MALAHDPGVARQLALEWGVLPATVARPQGIEELAGEPLDKARAIAALDPGETVVVTAGQTGRRGTTNLILLQQVPAPS